MSKVGPFLLVFHIAFLIFIAAPIVVVVLVAFTPTAYLSIPTTEFSLRWFRAIFASRDFPASFLISLELATVAASCALAIGIPAAFALGRSFRVAHRVLKALFLSPLLVPAIVLGVSLLRFLNQMGWHGTFASLVLCHTVVILPYVIRLLLTAIAGFDRAVETAALSLGASHLQTFRRVILPLIMPGVVGAWLVAFIMSLDELTMTIFVASANTTTFPVRLFDYLTQSTDPLVASVSTVWIALITLALIVLDFAYGLDRLLLGRAFDD
jgi:putative spermidine/putrescine transport system permease protein